jgi:hypothetical protein
MAYEASKPSSEPVRLKLDDADFLAIVRAECANALGMESGDELQADRERALQYYKGDMFDLPAMPNRSRAVHTAVADMIGQAMPDLVEVFLGGEELGAFRPQGEEDDEAAKQETETVNHVIHSDNDGFGLIHDYVHDALLMKAGVFHAYAERTETSEERTLEGQTALAVQQLQAGAQTGALEIVAARQTGDDPILGPLYTVEIAERRTNVRICVESVPPEDFAIARDTVSLRDATYAVMRRRPRAQALKALGYDGDLVDRLPAWSHAADLLLDAARDTAGEHAQPTQSADAVQDMRQVLVYVHIVRVDADGALELWRLVTNEACDILLDREKLDVMPFAMGTPYRQPHRAYGRSLADLSVELQRIMTALLRMHLDGGYFSLNARHEIDETRANEHTLADYLNNTPGYPVRSKGSALSPLNSARSDFNSLESLEYMATVGETRTGIVRNAQGLNPDTLHDTAKGAQALMTNAQKRLRLIARTLAETGIKDLFLLVHNLLRTSGMDRPLAMRLRNRWVEVDPTRWGERKDFRVEIGMGAGGREMDMQASVLISNLMEKIVAAQGQGAISPPIVTAKNAYAFADWLRDRAGVKRTSFFTDPESPAGQQLAQQLAQQPQQEDPAIVAAKIEMAARQQELEQKMAAEREKMAMKERHTKIQYEKDVNLSAQQQRDDLARAENEAFEKEREHKLALIRLQNETAEAARQAELDAAKLALEREKIALQREVMAAEAAAKEREFAVRERELEHSAAVESARIADAREARAESRVADDARRAEEAMRAERPPAPPAPDRSGEALGKGLEAIGEGLKAVARPKRVKRDKDGKVEGIE